jgi:DNA-binding CsgD family transcriptional regulator
LTSPKRDPVAVIEAAYGLESSTERWLEVVAESARPLLDTGQGVAAFLYRPKADGSIERGHTVMVGPDRGERAAFEAMHNKMPPQFLAGFYGRAQPCATVSEAIGSAPRTQVHIQHGGPLGHGDYIAVRATDPANRSGCILTAPRPELTRISPATRALWIRLTAHLSAGLRVRERLSALDWAPLRDADAVVTPAGKIEHADGTARSASAREALREAARAIDRARSSRGRQDPEGALELWRALVAGQWSLIDFFDSDGRRFFVARENAPDVTDPRALTARERQVSAYAALGQSNKEIAYSLGLGASTVATQLGRAMRKLGVQTRVELVQCLASIPADAPVSPPGSPHPG